MIVVSFFVPQLLNLLLAETSLGVVDTVGLGEDGSGVGRDFKLHVGWVCWWVRGRGGRGGIGRQGVGGAFADNGACGVEVL